MKILYYEISRVADKMKKHELYDQKISRPYNARNNVSKIVTIKRYGVPIRYNYDNRQWLKRDARR